MTFLPLKVKGGSGMEKPGEEYLTLVHKVQVVVKVLKVLKDIKDIKVSKVLLQQQ